MKCNTSVDSSRNGSDDMEKVMLPPDSLQSQATSGTVTVVARSNNKIIKLGK